MVAVPSSTAEVGYGGGFGSVAGWGRAFGESIEVRQLINIRDKPRPAFIAAPQPRTGIIKPSIQMRVPAPKPSIQ